MDHIKNHHFFYGVDWDTIRDIDAPFVPHLRSITDTSYFPTDDLDQIPESATELDSNTSTKDLAFLGFVNFQNDVVEFVDTIFWIAVTLSSASIIDELVVTQCWQCQRLVLTLTAHICNKTGRFWSKYYMMHNMHNTSNGFFFHRCIYVQVDAVIDNG